MWGVRLIDQTKVKSSRSKETEKKEKFIIETITLKKKIMSKLSRLLWLSSLFSILLFGFEGHSNIVLAQIRGENSDRFFRQGNELMEQQIRELQKESIRQQQENQAENEIKIEDNNKVGNPGDSGEDIQKKERELDRQLEMEKTSDVEMEETPDNPSALDNNLSESPEQEIEIKN